MTEYRIARPEEWEDCIELINYVFSYSHKPHDFEKLLPKVYGAGPEMAAFHRVAVDEEGRLRALVAVLPEEMTVAGEPLLAGYVGSVAVHPKARGQGHMRRLMDGWLQELAPEGARGKEAGAGPGNPGGDRGLSCHGGNLSWQGRRPALLALSGQRQRYGYFGFEPGDLRFVFEVNEANVRHFRSGAAPGGGMAPGGCAVTGGGMAPGGCAVTGGGMAPGGCAVTGGGMAPGGCAVTGGGMAPGRCAAPGGWVTSCSKIVLGGAAALRGNEAGRNLSGRVRDGKYTFAPLFPRAASAGSIVPSAGTTAPSAEFTVPPAGAAALSGGTAVSSASAFAMRLNEARPAWVRREPERMEAILSTFGQAAWGIYSEGSCVGFLLCCGEDSITEMALCGEADPAWVVADYLTWRGIPEVRIVVPSYCREQICRLSSFAETCRLEQEGLYRILDYGNVLEAYLRLKAQTLGIARGTFSAVLEGQPVTVDFDGETLQLRREALPDALVLGRREAHELLLSSQCAYGSRAGLSDEDWAEKIPLGWFPLPLFWHMADEF